MRKLKVVGRIYGMKYSWKGHKDRTRHKNGIKKEWASSVGLCQKHKQRHPNHVKVSPRGLISRRSWKPICVLPRLLNVSRVLPLILFQRWLDWQRRPISSFQSRSNCRFSRVAFDSLSCCCCCVVVVAVVAFAVAVVTVVVPYTSPLPRERWRSCRR